MKLEMKVKRFTRRVSRVFFRDFSFEGAIADFDYHLFEIHIACTSVDSLYPK